MTGWVENRVAIVTGSGRGIGRSTAILLAEEGARVVVNDLGCEVDGSGASRKAADRVVEEIRQLGGEAVANYESVATIVGAESIAECAIDNFGGIDILANCAGVQRENLFQDATEEDFDVLVATHLKGQFCCIKAVLPHMIAQGYGRIVTISSGSAMGLSKGEVVYGAAKAGVLGLTRGVAMEMKEYGITVNAVMPVARTRMQDSSQERVAAGIVKLPPGIGINEPPENIASTIVYLCTEKAGAITGRTFARRFAGTISLISNPSLVRSVYKNGVWTIDEIDGVVAQLVPEVEGTS
jgi:NAD(P)-dependent dehydrogenase (short-subunit alcohol dehydrogenase family)